MNEKIFELLIVGAGPAGISLAAEAINSGIPTKKILVIEKAPEHSWSIRKFYPENKLVTANFKGKAALCTGVLCIPNMSKSETLSYLDNSIKINNLHVNYCETVAKIIKKDNNKIFHIESDKGEYLSKTCVIAIGMFGKPNRPTYSIPNEIKKQISFDVTSVILNNKDILVVGGGDSASEYTQFLFQEHNRLILSYRKDSFSRMNSINKDSLLELSEEKKVKIIYNSNIDKVEQDQVNNKKILISFKENLKPIMVDHIVYALGGTTPTNFLKVLNINFIGDTPTIKDGFETSVPGLFLIGDLSAGKKGGSIISAFNSSNEAMKKICENYLECKI